MNDHTTLDRVMRDLQALRDHYAHAAMLYDADDEVNIDALYNMSVAVGVAIARLEKLYNE